jgi:hypothetical protein
VVIDEIEGKQYDAVGNLTFGPDSKRLAYWAKVDDKQFAVVDGVQGKQYSGQLQGGIVFDSVSSLYYLVLEGNRVYQVEETIE